MGGSPNDIRISDMRPTLVEPPMYKPKVVLLGKDKKGTVLYCNYTPFSRHVRVMYMHVENKAAQLLMWSLVKSFRGYCNSVRELVMVASRLI